MIPVNPARLITLARLDEAVPIHLAEDEALEAVRLAELPLRAGVSRVAAKRLHSRARGEFPDGAGGLGGACLADTIIHHRGRRGNWT